MEQQVENVHPHVNNVIFLYSGAVGGFLSRIHVLAILFSLILL